MVQHVTRKFVDTFTVEQLTKAATDYYRLGIKKHLRFGQYLCNNYLKQGETWPELFYEENNHVSLNIATTHLVEESVE